VFLLNIPLLLGMGLLLPEGLTVEDRSSRDLVDGVLALFPLAAAADASSRCTPRRRGWTVKVENMREGLDVRESDGSCLHAQQFQCGWRVRKGWRGTTWRDSRSWGNYVLLSSSWRTELRVDFCDSLYLVRSVCLSLPMVEFSGALFFSPFRALTIRAMMEGTFHCYSSSFFGRRCP